MGVFTLLNKQKVVTTLVGEEGCSFTQKIRAGRTQRKEVPPLDPNHLSELNPDVRSPLDMPGVDELDTVRASLHKQRTRPNSSAEETHTLQKCAVRNPRRSKNHVVATCQLGGAIDVFHVRYTH